MASPRRLDLHVSALNDAEYQLYTSSLADITLSDGQLDSISQDFDNLSVSVREARAWLRGRYSHLPAATLDSILRFFSPNLSQQDTLTGGQFFAALRLVVHAESGKDVDRALAFVQAHPPPHAISRPGSPPKHQGQAPPPAPSRKSSESTNPFSAPPQHPSFSHNPFSSSRSTSARSHDGDNDSVPPKLPPLPPRKPPPPIPGFQPPPRHGSFVGSTSGNLPPPPPPKPSLSHSQSSHVTSALMKQSLIASKNGKTIKQAEEQLEKERVLRVLKSSESSSSSASSSPFINSRGRSTSPNKTSSSASSSSFTSESDHNPPPLPKRNKKPPSPPMSTTSYQQVALAGMSNNTTPTPSSHNPFKSSPFQPVFSRSPSTSPSRKSTDLPPLPAGPPPKHPDQNSNFQSLSYRKPPPPVPSNLSSSNAISGTSSKNNHRPSFSQLRNSTESLTNDSGNKSFEAVYGSAPKTASPYVSSFTRAPSDVTPTRTRENDYFGDDGPSPGRMFRSKSLHHPSPPSLASRLTANEAGGQDGSPFSPLDGESPFASPGPSPMPRRKRPESVQVLGSKGNVLGANDRSPQRGNLGLGDSPLNLSRHASFSTPSPPTASLRKPLHQRKVSGSSPVTTTSDNPLKSLAASLQPQLSSMQQQLQPHLDKARFKAEAGLSKRGFVREHGSIIRRREEEEGLMRDGSWEQSLESDEDVSDDNDESHLAERRSASDGVGLASRNGNEVGKELGRVSIEKDNLKWPVAEGEGWRPL
ncbi:hypothetical protein GYMLUDRAFT_32461 [Collybiopsis luxurians FD-317 M1]|nr:hypothetical protein GYMLUDRAFT_32461 [Collybiopsis luxurians FD-317 M1]